MTLEQEHRHDTIVILDFGSQYTQLIARAVRQLGVYSLILPYTTPLESIQALTPRGVILSGGPASVTAKDAPHCDAGILTGDWPILGICYGMQLLCLVNGGRVAAGKTGEYGRARIRLDGAAGDDGSEICSDESGASPLFAHLAADQIVWMSHGDRVEALPKGWRATAFSRSDGSPGAGLLDESGGTSGTASDRCMVACQSANGRVLAVQFHPEVAHTPQGRAMLSNFVLGICQAHADWTPAAFISETITAIRAEVAGGKVILGYSGGVDSTVAAVLLKRAVGDRLICVFVDNGLLRLNEREEVRERFETEIGIPLHVFDHSAAFLTALEGVSEPETKRKIIGKTFIDAFAEALRLEQASLEARDATGVEYLAQGTLYPDVIESVSASGGPSATIKTHHNVGGLPKDLNFKLIEPLRQLFKDDVRRIGRELGIAPDMLGRHPFPGPGLAIRCLGEITPKRLATLQQADAIFISELRAAGEYDRTAQALAVLLPVKSVGVMGDSRTYEEVIALRAVTSVDFMTADWAVLPPELLARVSNRIINEVSGVNRVVYDISSKPPATIEWE